jgi:hypothetical protein
LSFPEEANAYFELKNIVIGSPDTSLGMPGTVSDDCAHKIFKITLYDESHNSVGRDGDPATTLCDYFRNGTDTVDNAIRSECVDDMSSPYTSSIYFEAAAASEPAGDKTYTINFHNYNLSLHNLYIDPSNITVETVSDYPVIGG